MSIFKNAVVFVHFCLLFNISFSPAQGAESEQDPNLLLSKAREVFSGNLKITIKANGFFQIYSQRLRQDGGRDTREEFPLGTNSLGEINDTHYRIKILNAGGAYEIYPAGLVAIHDPFGIKNKSRFAGVILSNDPFFISKAILVTNKSIPEVVVEFEYTSSVWKELNTNSKTAYRVAYWFDQKTSLPVRAVINNKEGEVLTVVEFLSIEPNPAFSHFDFTPEENIAVFSDVTMDREVDIITKKVPFTVGKIAKSTRYIRNPSTPSLINIDLGKIVASNLAKIKVNNNAEISAKNRISRIIVLFFVVVSLFSLIFPLGLKIFRRYKNKL